MRPLANLVGAFGVVAAVLSAGCGSQAEPPASAAAASTPATSASAVSAEAESLIKAAKEGGDVAGLLSKGIDPNVRDGLGLTPLHHAVQPYGNLRASFGFNNEKLTSDLAVSAEDARAAQARLDGAKRLIEKGADVNAKAADGRTPLFEASPQGAELLLASGAAVDVRDSSGNTVLHDKAARLLYDTILGEEYLRTRMEEFIQCARLLTAKGFDLNSKNQEGKTVLDVAVSTFASATTPRSEVEKLPHVAFLIQSGAK